MNKYNMELATLISIFALIVSAFAYQQAKNANDQYAAVEKLNVEAEVAYFSNLCADAECLPTLTVRNTGKIAVSQLSVTLTPALVPKERDGFLMKYLFSDWNQTIALLRPGENVTLNYPKGFLTQIVGEGRKLEFSFADDTKYNASTIPSDRILIEVQTKYVRESDLKEYKDRMYYIQNKDGSKWVSIDQASDAPTYADMLVALKSAEGLDISDYINRIGSDKVYRD